MRHGSVFIGICLCVCLSVCLWCYIFWKPIELESLFLACRYIFEISSSNSYINDIGLRTRLLTGVNKRVCMCCSRLACLRLENWFELPKPPEALPLGYRRFGGGPMRLSKQQFVIGKWSFFSSLFARDHRRTVAFSTIVTGLATHTCQYRRHITGRNFLVL